MFASFSFCDITDLLCFLFVVVGGDEVVFSYRSMTLLREESLIFGEALPDYFFTLAFMYSLF